MIPYRMTKIGEQLLTVQHKAAFPGARFRSKQSSVALLSSAQHAEFFITIDHKELGGKMAGGRRQWRRGGKGCRSCGSSAVDSFHVSISRFD